MRKIQHQRSLQLITHQTNSGIVQQRATDGYINATALCKAAGKRIGHYLENKTTKDFLTELSTDVGIPTSQLIQIVRSGTEPQGTWVHPQVAINLAQWLSAKFAVQVSRWVHDWLSGRAAPANLPSHLARYLANDPKVLPGYFSVLQETALNLFGPMHNVGFIIPEDWVPDISVGRLFCKWLREQQGIDTDALQTYKHEYPDGRKVDAKLYPDIFLADFRTWFREVWLPSYGVRYFKRKDPDSLMYIDQHPALAAPTNARIFKKHRSA